MENTPKEGSMQQLYDKFRMRTKTWLEVLETVGDTPENRDAALNAFLTNLGPEGQGLLHEEALPFLAHIKDKDPRLWLAGISPQIRHWTREEKDQFHNLLKATRNGHANQDTEDTPIYSVVSDTEPEAVRWLWWPYLASGTVAMLDGDPGVGKSLITIQLASVISRGWPLPDQEGKPTLDTTPNNVLLLAAEDSVKFTIRPRLDRAGGDPNRVYLMSGMFGKDGKEEAFTLQHIDALRTALGDIQPALVVIDPIQAYLGPIDMHRANETRPLMSALGKAAEEFNTCIVCVRHPAKPGAGAGKVLLRGLGSVDMIGAARTGLFVEQHPLDREKAMLMQSKSNLGTHGRTLIFSKSKGQFEWCGVTRADAETLCGLNRGPDPLSMIECLFSMEAMLEGGASWRSADVTERLEQEGHSPKVIKGARKKLGIQSKQLSDGWWLSLPTLS